MDVNSLPVTFRITKLWYALVAMSGDEKIKIKIVRLIKSSVEEMTEGMYTLNSSRIDELGNWCPEG